MSMEIVKMFCNDTGLLQPADLPTFHEYRDVKVRKTADLPTTE